jgi:manganese/zinc/iron transport system ATP- binding protein
MKRRPSSKYALDIDHLMVNYEKNCVLFDLCLKVPSGKLVAILGPNGAGKTSFIKSILGLIKPISGQVRFFGGSLSEKRKEISYIPQVESIDWRFPITVFDLVLMGSYAKLSLFRRPSKKEREEARALLSRVGMEAYGERQIGQLSGGQRQRVFIARALMQKAELYFMDEPFSGVDLQSQEVIGSILKELRDEGKTIFVVHHGLERVHELFDWVIFLNRSLVGQGPVQEFFTAEMVKRAFGSKGALFDEISQLIAD